MCACVLRRLRHLLPMFRNSFSACLLKWQCVPDNVIVVCRAVYRERMSAFLPAVLALHTLAYLPIVRLGFDVGKQKRKKTAYRLPPTAYRLPPTAPAGHWTWFDQY